MASSILIPHISISDVPAKAAKPFKALGIVKDVETREVANGYVQVTVILEYQRDDGSESTFYARWNVRPEWFTPDYVARVKNNEVEGTEKTQFDINMCGLSRGVCDAAGLTEIDFDQLPGNQVGFKTKVRKSDPSRLDISYFYPPSKD